MKPGLLGSLLLLLATDAFAHRLDEYLQAIRISVATNRIDVSIDLTPGVAVADQVVAAADKDQDGRVSEAEVAAYAQRVLKDIRVGLDEKALALSLVDASFPALEDVKKGVGVIRIKTTAPVGPLAVGKHALSLTNAHLPAISVYLVNALTPKDRAIKITKQTRDELQKNYRLEFRMLPKVISEKVGPTCWLATTPGWASLPFRKSLLATRITPKCLFS